MSSKRAPEGSAAHHRINFLFQAALAVSAENPGLSRYYVQTLLDVAEKNVVRLDASVKHFICKCCKSILSPGLTCEMSVDGDLVVFECSTCHQKKRFGAPPPGPAEDTPVPEAVS